MAIPVHPKGEYICQCAHPGNRAISEERYSELLDSEKKLNALEAGGVDNWEWYSESLQQAGYWDDES